LILCQTVIFTFKKSKWEKESRQVFTSDFRNKKKQRKFTQTDKRENRQQENTSKFATMEEALLGFVRQARNRNLALTREIIHITRKIG
jgi:hypothetical protein